MPRGGRRAGAPGKAYGNRSDLNTNRAPVRIGGQAYGMQAEQVRAQQAVPVGPTPTVGVPSPAPAPTGTPAPTALIPLDAPTMRPNEPVTAGSPSGPGPGPAAPLMLGAPPVLINAAAALSTIPDAERDPDTARLLNLIQAQIGNSAAV